MKKLGKLFIVSAPSGAGKTTLVNKVVKNLGPIYKVERLVTFTTKSPRPGEISGRDYHYIDNAEFEIKASRGFFAEITKGLGHYYGTPQYGIDDLKQGKSYIVVIDREGAEQLLRSHPDSVLIWVQVKDVEILKDRLLTRGSESLEQIEKRLLRAQKEIEWEAHNNLYHYKILNDDLNKCVKNLENIITTELSK